MIRIRRYQPEDLAVIADLMKDLGYPASIEMMRKRMNTIENLQDHHTYIALFEERAAGMIGIRKLYSYEEDGFVTQISLLVTKKELEGKGIGTALVRFAEHVAREDGGHTLYLTSGMKPERERAHTFYRSLGFETTGYRFVKKW
ncbi:GNAT family N-acetyltransferase [Paenibacillus harenae]|uniref:GNAT family N-acetyltransferase n=1 Tax=Paenibacillus harenae TaxID=306543 RepID=UPI00040A8826|nr:GNAT family N-acetyltransferase [Paenibacillus harenae]